MNKKQSQTSIPDRENSVKQKNVQSTARDYFLQDPPRLGNQYLEDSALREVLQRVTPPNILKDFESDLIPFGDRVLGEILSWGRESENNPPKLLHHNGWGRRVDQITVANGWKELQKVSAEEGLIAIGYERKHKEWSRLHQFVKLYIFTPSACVFGCPLAMTDGAARLFELWGTKEDLAGPYQQLVSRDPSKFWTSGQWMTERSGGSDVGGTETIAKKRANGLYELTGYKFFTSAITSEMALTLARIEDVDGKSTAGSRGLSCFFVETYKGGELNNITVHRLKNKLGTKAVPTAELELNGTEAKLVGPEYKGVPVIATILNITRIHNAMASVAAMRRGIAVARDYAHRRQVTGKFLSQLPLHLTTLTEMEIQFRGALQFLIEVLILMGKVECKVASQDEDITLRLLTPLLKLYTAKQSIAVTSEAIESLGGTGYMEDSDMPRLLRDTQVGSIWEGTTNVLSLDIWRPIRSNGALEIYMTRVKGKMSQIKNTKLKSSVDTILQSLDHLATTAKKLANQPDILEAVARQFAYGLSRTYIATLLLEQAQWSGKDVDIEIARRWTKEQVLVELRDADSNYINLTKNIALDIDPKTNQPRGCGDITPHGKVRSRY